MHLWEAIADRYKGDPWVAGYNLMNEPADESRAVVGPFYARLAAAIRAVDPDHMLFLDGNTYSTEFDFFGEPLDNAVYALHDYVPSGPQPRRGVRPRAPRRQKFLQRSAYARRTGTPIYVGEFAPIYTGDPEVDAERLRILDDQLELYRRHGAGFATWMYKDLGRQGLVHVPARLARTASWWRTSWPRRRASASTSGAAPGGRTARSRSPSRTSSRASSPASSPTRGAASTGCARCCSTSPSRSRSRTSTPSCSAGCGDDDLVALADSWAFAACAVREPLRDQLANS